MRYLIIGIERRLDFNTEWNCALIIGAVVLDTKDVRKLADLCPEVLDTE
jgi:hypothetical protein